MTTQTPQTKLLPLQCELGHFVLFPHVQPPPQRKLFLMGFPWEIQDDLMLHQESMVLRPNFRNSLVRSSPDHAAEKPQAQVVTIVCRPWRRQQETLSWASVWEDWGVLSGTFTNC